MIETDSPYLTPEPYRGKRNKPTYVKFVAQKIAEIKGISFEEVCETTSQNAIKLFNLPSCF
ncbi:Mg-dependent DNase [Caldanaerobacter subterraneus subsp. pacificus DSM 12653]|uniref:Mg-dependent DNase n=1 Tax=Caldanaerobacter subterraneus subsp. pacificus DSM 12653 TaxID=391606 RepID=A0A0F5PSR0_9THEO|nr:Mg-dependent DNase [Caldanaerobacter subterraneus subsp. pacificus DSM 12653]